MKLSAAEIKARLVELRNLRRLHANCAKTKAELRAALEVALAKIKEQETQINKLALQVAEL